MEWGDCLDILGGHSVSAVATVKIGLWKLRTWNLACGGDDGIFLNCFVPKYSRLKGDSLLRIVKR